MAGKTGRYFEVACGLTLLRLKFVYELGEYADEDIESLWSKVASQGFLRGIKGTVNSISMINMFFNLSTIHETSANI